MTKANASLLFNSPIETGVRSLSILVSGYPESFDLDRLVEMDYLVVHSGDIGGPESLHTPLPHRSGELLVRRGLIESGLTLMMSRGLVQLLVRSDGFRYVASDLAAPFLASMTTAYFRRLMERADWASLRFSSVATEEIRRITRGLMEGWTSQFEALKNTEQSHD